MPYIPPSVVQEVKRMDLLTYLKNYEPYELVHFSGNTYTTRTHDSLKISNGKWMWWSQRTGGRSALDYLIKVRGYSFKFRKDITIRLEGRERGLKLKRNFGENYSLEAIRVRILEENELPAEKKFPVQRHYRIRVSDNFKQTRKIGGLRGLYLHYCYLLGILPKNRPSISAKQVHVLFREDLLKLNTISKEMKLLCHYHIDTVEQLFS